ncbi:MAG TPA: DNA double-strand break repair nuclease NurA [Acidimicrobiia bacterium]|nr:DNA double-strand break repair nuclease NurA [Acidimicrobiia bacterium]
MKFTVQPWSPEYGAPSGREDIDAAAVDIDVEVKAASWSPIPVRCDPAPEVMFVDGVRRIDANLWIDEDDGTPTLALAASYAAGAVICNHSAKVVGTEVRRGVFATGRAANDIETKHARYQVHMAPVSTAEELSWELQMKMGDLEALIVANQGGQAGLIVADGPLSHRPKLLEAVGYVKTHQTHYLPPGLRSILSQLTAGDRTPLFLTGGSWSRYSWYLKLPLTGGGPMDGIIRAEITSDRDLAAARQMADLTAATLCRFASSAHKDPRAPQNLYPIGGLEKRLHHLLGDRDLMYRSLRVAASRN